MVKEFYTKDHLGRDVYHRKTILEHPKYYLEQCNKSRHNLIAKYKNGVGTATRNMRTFFLRDMSRLGGIHPLQIKRLESDFRDFEILKKNKIPIIPTYSAVS